MCMEQSDWDAYIPALCHKKPRVSPDPSSSSEGEGHVGVSSEGIVVVLCVCVCDTRFSVLAATTFCILKRL